MDDKELKIIAPEGYEIDREKSSFEKIVFKKKEVKITNYDDIAKNLFEHKLTYFITSVGSIASYAPYVLGREPHNAPTREQLEWILAINKLQNVANFLNGDWEPDWKNVEQTKWRLCYSTVGISVTYTQYSIGIDVYFKTKKLALKAVEILGEEDVKKALRVYKHGRY